MLCQVTGGVSAVPLGPLEMRSTDHQEGELRRCRLSSNPRAVGGAFHYGGIASSMQHYPQLPDSLSLGCVHQATEPSGTWRVSLRAHWMLLLSPGPASPCP